MSGDDECEEWVGWLDIPPSRVVRMTGLVRRAERMSLAELRAMDADPTRTAPVVTVPVVLLDDEADARIEALARAHEPTTGASTPLRRKADV